MTLGAGSEVALLVAAAVWVGVGQPARHESGRAWRATGEVFAATRGSASPSWLALSALAALVVLLVVLLGGGGVGASVVILLLTLGAGAAGLRSVVSTMRFRRARRQRQQAVLELCDALSAELRAGLPVTHALDNAIGRRAEWSSITAAARLGVDVGGALRRCSVEPGAEDLRALAAAWQVASHSGVALADVLDRLADALRSRDEARAEVVAALGPPRATAKMLAVLPLFGVALGTSMGARPVEFLLATTPGLLCLTSGVGLALLGVYWVERLASAAEAAA